MLFCHDFCGILVKNCGNITHNWKINKKFLNKYAKYIENSQIIVNICCYLGDLKSLKHFVKNGYKVTKKCLSDDPYYYSYFSSEENKTPYWYKYYDYELTIACYYNHFDIVEFLVNEQGVNVNLDNYSPLTYAHENKNLKIIKFLVKKGLNIEKLFEYSIVPNSLSFMKFLLNEGVNLNMVFKYASKKGYLNIVKILVNKGADITADDNYAVSLASEGGHLEVVKFLVSKGADITAEDNYAVRLASMYSHYEIVKFLVSKGADINTKIVD